MYLKPVVRVLLSISVNLFVQHKRIFTAIYVYPAFINGDFTRLIRGFAHRREIPRLFLWNIIAPVKHVIVIDHRGRFFRCRLRQYSLPVPLTLLPLPRFVRINRGWCLQPNSPQKEKEKEKEFKRLSLPETRIVCKITSVSHAILVRKRSYLFFYCV